MCQGLGDFSGFLHHFELAKLATSSIRVKRYHQNSRAVLGATGMKELRCFWV